MKTFQKIDMLKQLLISSVFIIGSLCVVSLRAGDCHEPIFVLTPPDKLFENAIEGLRSELEEECSVTVLKKSKNDDTKDIEQYFSSTRPKAVVVVGNRLLIVYLKYIKEKNETFADIPVISIYAIGTERFIGTFKHAFGISCQTPLLTAVVRFRDIMNKPMKTVGVIHRKVFEESIVKSIQLCNREKITIKNVIVGDEENRLKKEISGGLKKLIKKDKIEALWIPNDNVILRPQLLIHVWLPLCNRYKIPVIVGVEALVKPEIDFGTFAVIPDPLGTGLQAAHIIFDLKDDDWKMGDNTVYPPISVYSVLNYKKAQTISNTIDLKKITKIFGE